MEGSGGADEKILMKSHKASPFQMYLGMRIPESFLAVRQIIRFHIHYFAQFSIVRKITNFNTNF